MVTCGYCKQQRHFFSQCRKIKCKKCKKVGHVDTYCTQQMTFSEDQKPYQDLIDLLQSFEPAVRNQLFSADVLFVGEFMTLRSYHMSFDTSHFKDLFFIKNPQYIFAIQGHIQFTETQKKILKDYKLDWKHCSYYAHPNSIFFLYIT